MDQSNTILLYNNNCQNLFLLGDHFASSISKFSIYPTYELYLYALKHLLNSGSVEDNIPQGLKPITYFAPV
jgi:hypothetical protein